MTPKLTVLLAVHNGERWLAGALESVLRQTWEDFELLVVDDGSRDRSVEIVASYRDERIRLLRAEEHRGLAAALNRGLAHASAELVARQDADDVSDPRRFERQLTFLDAHPDVALLGTWYRRIDASGRQVATRRLPCDASLLRLALLFYCPFVHTSIMMRGAVARELGGYDEAVRYAEDFELWSRIARRAPVANLPEALVGMRVHETSMTSTMADLAAVELPRICVENVRWVLARGGGGDTTAVDAHRLWSTLALPREDVARRDGRGEVRSAAGRLLDAFARAYRLEPEERGRARDFLHEMLWRRRVEEAERCTDLGDGATAWSLLRDAIALHPPGALHPRSLRLMRRAAGRVVRRAVPRSH